MLFSAKFIFRRFKANKVLIRMENKMKINNVQNNQQINFKARLEGEIGAEVIDFIRNGNIGPAAACRCGQGIIDSIDLFKQVAPLIGKDSDVLAIRPGNLAKTGDLDVFFNEKKLGSIFNSPDFATGFRNEESLPVMHEYVSQLTKGVLGFDDLYPPKAPFWNPFHAYVGKPNSGRLAERNLVTNGLNSTVIKTEVVSRDEIADKLSQLDIKA